MTKYNKDSARIIIGIIIVVTLIGLILTTFVTSIDNAIEPDEYISTQDGALAGKEMKLEHISFMIDDVGNMNMYVDMKMEGVGTIDFERVPVVEEAFKKLLKSYVFQKHGIKEKANELDSSTLRE